MIRHAFPVKLQVCVGTSTAKQIGGSGTAGIYFQRGRQLHFFLLLAAFDLLYLMSGCHVATSLEQCLFSSPPLGANASVPLNWNTLELGVLAWTSNKVGFRLVSTLDGPLAALFTALFQAGLPMLCSLKRQQEQLFSTPSFAGCCWQPPILADQSTGASCRV